MTEPTESTVDIATDQDMSEVLSLLQMSFSGIQRSTCGDRGPDFWQWKYRQSPFGPALVQIVRIEGQVAAAGCLWPIRLRLGNRSLNALQPCDTAVHPQFRRRGLFGQLNEARKVLAAEWGADLMFNFPNSNSLPGYLKSGWRHVGRVPWLLRVLKPIAVLRDRIYPGKSAAMEIPARYQFDERESVELKVEDSKPARIVTLERPPNFWKWRFCQHPTRQYGLIRSAADERGIALFTLSQTSSGLVEMVLVDMLAKPGTVSALLQAVLQCAKTVDAAFIAMMKPQGLSAGQFYRRAFLPMREKNLAILPLDPDLPSQLGKMSCWDFRAAMHDSI